MVHKLIITMASREGLGNFIINEEEIGGTTLDIFNIPEKENTFISGKEVEIRLITVLERFVQLFFNLQGEGVNKIIRLTRSIIF